ncbi:hypothetical protein Lesp02_03380 [Lentzea sp. NBRC 105346]|uniref:hypothetical protein n=1 Tax=Lentzea sp. NBRC 105346 TaxID=3032205 RepID=UPI0024A394AC|nr:hypothetical protein [Lentzea sp. NBRC 105346]GLZ28148.1 hypothetical protein Lesp02_03380 [Lentzea sp. NBRC 105346]
MNLAVTLAQLRPDSFDPLQNIILPLLGTVLLIVMGFRLVSAYIEDRPGKILGALLGALPAAMAVFFPAATMGILKGLAQVLVGGG